VLEIVKAKARAVWQVDDLLGGADDDVPRANTRPLSVHTLRHEDEIFVLCCLAFVVLAIHILAFRDLAF